MVLFSDCSFEGAIYIKCKIYSFEKGRSSAETGQIVKIEGDWLSPKKYERNISQIWKKYLKKYKKQYFTNMKETFINLKEISQKYERNIAQIWKGLNQFFFPFTLGQSNISLHFFALLKGQWLEWATFVNCARVFAQRLQGHFAIFWQFKDFVLFASITIDFLLLHTFIIHDSFKCT